MDWNPEPTEPPLSVGVLTQHIKRLLEGNFGEVWVRGEVSNVRYQSSGHVYFTLKDREAQLSAAMFRSSVERNALRLEEGMAVLVCGRVTVYPPRGNYQLVATLVRREGEGELRRRFEGLKAKLAAEGLFDPARKQPLPTLPRTIVVITSPTGAAIRDFLSILRRRRWRGTIRLLPVRVQGVEAAPEIVAMLERANREHLGDVIVVTRGGGSLEDLWPFNEEVVARAIAGSARPVVSAVGHEIDFTLSDFAADVRAETPSAAAEMLSSQFVAFAESVQRARRQLHQILTATTRGEHLRLDSLRQRLLANTPRHRLEQAWMRLDDVAARRNRLWESARTEARETLGACRYRLGAVDPRHRVGLARENLRHLALRLRQASPATVLARGYAIVRDAKGTILQSADAARKSPRIEVEWADGRAPFQRRPEPPEQGQLSFPE